MFCVVLLTHLFLKMAVADTGSYSSSCAAKVLILELELKKVPQSTVLRTMTAYGSCSMDAIKGEILRTIKWFTQSENGWCRKLNKELLQTET